MKKTYSFLLIIFFNFAIFSQISFYGDLTTTTSANVKQNNYSSKLNPANIFEIQDFNITNDFNIKIANGDGGTDFEVWFAIYQYPIYEAIASAAYGDISQQTIVSEFIALSTSNIFTFALNRANISFYLGDNLRIKLGNQLLESGYGYAWTPMSLASLKTNPTNPKADQAGINAIQLYLFPYSPLNIKTFGYIGQEQTLYGISYNDITIGGELTLSSNFIEIKTIGIYNFNAEDKNIVPAISSGFLADILGLGFYGEIAYHQKSRNQYPDGFASLDYIDEYKINGLLGIEYTFPFELSLILEYYYNGEGWNKENREKYYSNLDLLVDSAHYLRYRPAYFSVHYAMLNLLLPIYDLNINNSLTAIYSIDSGALTIFPEISWQSSGSLEVKASYTGLFSLYDNFFDENTLSPIKHSFSITAVFNY